MASIREETPLTGADLENWTAGLNGVDAAVASVVAGVDTRALERWLAAKPSRSLPKFLIWRWDDALRLRNSADVLDRDTGRLTSGFYVDSAHSEHPPPARLAVTGNVLPAEVVPLLLACPGVGSAVIPVQRAPGALRRRACGVHPVPGRIGVRHEKPGYNPLEALHS